MTAPSQTLSVSPYAQASARLIEQGFSAIPIMPGDKSPGAYKGGRWVNQTDWTRFCDRRPTDFETRIWLGWPEAGVGVCLGPASGNLVGIDLDYGSADIRKAIESCLPLSPVKKRGAKGYTAFFRGDPNLHSKVFRLLDPQLGRKVSVCEILARGRQTLLPPTIHPDTQKPYHWLTPDTLDDIDIADLPFLPADFADTIESALRPFGYEPELVLGTPAKHAYSAGQDETIWRSLNNSALADLGAWVPALGLHGLRGDHTRYEAVATWRSSNRGRPTQNRQRNLKIAPNGIKDFGDDRSYTPLDLVMAASDVPLDNAFEWLHRRVIPAAATIMLEPRENTEAPPHDPETGELLEEVASAEPEAAVPAESEISDDSDTPHLPDDLTHVPGLLGEIVDWMTDTADRPARALNLGMSIVFLGALFGRRFESPTLARTNFYIATLAASGFGKSHPMKRASALAFSAGVEHLMASNRIKSDTGLRTRLEETGSCFYMLDEFGGHIRPWLSRNAKTHQANIRDLILTLFAMAADVYLGDDYGAGGTDPIFNPHLCMYGTCGHADFWRSFEGGNIADGFLPRFILLDAGTRRPLSVEPRLDAEPPFALIQAVRGASGLSAKLGNLAPHLRPSGKNRPNTARVPWGQGAGTFWHDMRSQIDDEQNKAEVEEAPIIARIAEHAQKLALVRAVGIDHEKPAIAVSDLEWGLAVARASAVMMLAQAGDLIADNPFQADYLKVRRIISDAGRRGATKRELAKRLKGSIEPRKLADILQMLDDAGDVQKARFGTKAGPPREAFVADIRSKR